MGFFIFSSAQEFNKEEKTTYTCVYNVLNPAPRLPRQKYEQAWEINVAMATLFFFGSLVMFVWGWGSRGLVG